MQEGKCLIAAYDMTLWSIVPYTLGCSPHKSFRGIKAADGVTHMHEIH